MCGIYGWSMKPGRKPDPTLIVQLAQRNDRRGPHAFGFAWRTEKGGVGHYKQPGSIAHNLRELRPLGGASSAIVHTRWATMGDPQENANNHPFEITTDKLLVANGTLTDVDTMVDDYGLRMRTDCDSEAIARRFAQRRIRKLGLRLAASIEDALQYTSKAALSAAVLTDSALAVVRAGKPLWYLPTWEGTYFSSLPGV